MPGLGSNSNDIYIVNLVNEGYKRGYLPVVINYRGASGVNLTSPIFYCQGSLDDLGEPLKYIYSNYC